MLNDKIKDDIDNTKSNMNTIYHSTIDDDNTIKR